MKYLVGIFVFASLMRIGWELWCWIFRDYCAAAEREEKKWPTV